MQKLKKKPVTKLVSMPKKKTRMAILSLPDMRDANILADITGAIGSVLDKTNYEVLVVNTEVRALDIEGLEDLAKKILKSIEYIKDKNAVLEMEQ